MSVQLGIHRAKLDSNDVPFGLDWIERMIEVERFLIQGQERTLTSPIYLPMTQTELIEINFMIYIFKNSTF